MTKKDYILIAKAIARTDALTEKVFASRTHYRNTLLQNLADTFKEDNLRFDRLKFLKFIDNAKLNY